MALPLFFHDGPLNPHTEVLPDEDTSRHIVQVLRMLPGEKLRLTDGKGRVAEAVITRAGKKKCALLPESLLDIAPGNPSLHLCVAFTKNAGRNEWLLEKATELGVKTIVPLLAQRSEKERFREDRWRNILISAMLQSQQYHLPLLTAPLPLGQILQRFNGIPCKLIGHCAGGEPRQALHEALQKGRETVMLIGPEGDFTPSEIQQATSQGFGGIALGTQRLRTETAAMAVCAYFNLLNYDA